MHFIAFICFILAFIFYLLDSAYATSGLVVMGFLLEAVAWLLLAFTKDKTKK